MSETTSQPISADIQAVLEKMRANTRVQEERYVPAIDAADPFRVCADHRERQPLDREESLWQSVRHSSPRIVYVPCGKCRAAGEAADQRRYWRKRGVPDRLLEATFGNFEPVDASRREGLHEAMTYARTAAQPLDPQVDLSALRGGFMTLLGTTGAGKGHLAVSAMKALGKGGLFITHADLLTDLRASYQTGETQAFLNRLKDAPCLILDEFGLSGGGKDEAPVLYQVLAARYDRRLPTIITSNEELPTVRDALGYRLVDRIREDHALINLRGESYRNRKAA